MNLSPMDELMIRLEVEVLSQRKKQSKAWIFKTLYYVIPGGIIASIVIGIVLVINTPSNAQSGWFLTKMAVAFALGSLALSYLQFIGVGRGDPNTDELKDISYILTINTIALLLESKEIPPLKKEELLKQVIERSAKIAP